MARDTASADADMGHDEGYDAGLVHGHGWASAEGGSRERIVVQAEQWLQAAWREDTAEGHSGGDAYDDGLVHDHGWASSL